MSDALHGERDPGGFRPRVLPPVWAALFALGVVALGRWLGAVDIAQVDAGMRDVLGWIGIVVVVAGSALSAWAAWGFSGARTPIEPGRVSTSLLVGGPYRISRNPIYLGMATALAGLALFLGQPGAIVLVPVFCAVLQWRIIRHEERMLGERFGAEYAAYRERVRRWL